MEVKAAALLNAVPPYGHVFAHERWRNSSVAQSLKGAGVKLLFEAELGVADFHLPKRSCVLFVSEGDVVSGTSYRRKLVRFRNACSSSSLQQVVLVESTALTQQYLGSVQRFVVLDLGLTLLPLGGRTEAAQLLAHMVFSGGRDDPFRRSCGSGPVDPVVLSVVQQVPGVGRVKALALLHKFSSIQQLCNSAPSELEAVIGPAAAQQIHSFFHRSLKEG